MQEALEQFKPFLKAFGTGPKGNRDLSKEESHHACKLILEQKIPSEVIGAFLIAWRLKGETVDEMLGALSSLKNDALSLENIPNSIEIAMPMEGKKKNIPLIILTAKQLKNEHFVITASRSSKDSHAVSMMELSDLLPSNISLILRENFLPKLDALSSLRNNLSLKTAFNTLEKLQHPLQSEYAVIGAHHGPYFKKYASIFSAQYKRLMILQGDEGCGEIIKKSKIVIIEDEKIKEQFFLDPEDFNISFEKSEDFLSSNTMREQLLSPSNDIQKLAKLNAALYLYLKDPSSSIKKIFTSL